MTHATDDLAGLRAIVSGGGGSGIGSSAVEKLVARGAEVHVLDLRAPTSPVESFQHVNLSDPAAISSAVRAIGGPVHALFNCVGVAGNTTTPLETMTINYVGVRELSDAVVPLMPPGAAITTIASRGGSAWPARLDTWLELAATDRFAGATEWLLAHPDEFLSAYGASKEAISVWTMYSAVILGATGIRSNAIMPGPTQSPMYEQFYETTSKAYMDSFPVPLGRTQTVSEQAEALIFLGSPAASGITGTLLHVDGGTNAGLTTGLIQLPIVV
jgi:NAD(P)-dependent dehydrogenase (short-subunit alcohol dehydrogenase family)